MFYDKFKGLCDQRGLSPSAVVKALGLSTGNIAAWKRGQTPKYERLVAIADYLGVSVQELVDDESRETKPLWRLLCAQKCSRKLLTKTALG